MFWEKIVISSLNVKMEETLKEGPATRESIFPLPHSLLTVIHIFLAKEEEKGKGQKTEREQEGKDTLNSSP